MDLGSVMTPEIDDSNSDKNSITSAHISIIKPQSPDQKSIPKSKNRPKMPKTLSKIPKNLSKVLKNLSKTSKPQKSKHIHKLPKPIHKLPHTARKPSPLKAPSKHLKSSLKPNQPIHSKSPIPKRKKIPMGPPKLMSRRNRSIESNIAGGYQPPLYNTPGNYVAKPKTIWNKGLNLNLGKSPPGGILPKLH